ncbi:DUF2017 domain-containing protein [Nocardioides daejeonensis]|uniref:DUF2017 domain-containing protein n=1 Tax=Nocardioides daejeonensis TaxID=1046556 RepID=UPI000D746A5F|nr:DUF2017 domain-containing protein [Nocardioides daejeonensis]
MTGFERHRRSGRTIANFTGFEADLLRSLASQLVELLRDEAAAPVSSDPLEALFDFTGPTTVPEDPVLARLFPSAYVDDEEAAGEFRRYTESTLRSSKATAAIAIIDDLEEAGLPAELTDEGLYLDVELDLPRAQLWMRSFTDIRLALATRLGIEEGDEARWAALPDDDPVGQAHDIYEWVGYLQETLVDALGD